MEWRRFRSPWRQVGCVEGACALGRSHRRDHFQARGLFRGDSAGGVNCTGLLRREPLECKRLQRGTLGSKHLTCLVLSSFPEADSSGGTGPLGSTARLS